MLSTLIKSKTRLRLLIKFFVNIQNEGYLNGLANEFVESTNTCRKELNNLSSAGYLVKKARENKIFYSANKKHPLFKVIQQIIHKYLGLEEIIEKVYERIGFVDKIALLGDYALGIDSGFIEVLIIGDNIDLKYLKQLESKIEKVIERKVCFLVSNKLPNQNYLILIEN